MTQKTKKRRGVRDRYLRARSNWRHIRRQLFVSPAETRFVRVMGGHAITVPLINVRTMYGRHPLTFLFLGRVLRRELIEHEVRIGSRYADFATPNAAYLKVIELDGKHHQMDIVADQEREDYLRQYGAEIYRIQARRLWREPWKVRREVLRFLRS